MYYAEAQAEIIDFSTFCRISCNSCNSEWYCPSYCDVLEKASKMDFDLIIRAYARNDGDMQKVFRYIKNTKKAVRSNGRL